MKHFKCQASQPEVREDLRSDINLWASVINTGLVDLEKLTRRAVKNSRVLNDPVFRGEVVDLKSYFFNGDRSTFMIACDACNLNPDLVRDKVRGRIKNLEALMLAEQNLGATKK